MIQPVSFGSEKVSGEAESLSAQKPLEEHCYGSMTIFMYLQGDAAKMGEAKRTQELNSLNLPLTSFPPGAVAAVPEGALFVVPGHTRKRAGGCQWSGAADNSVGTASAVAAAQDMRPLHTLIPTKLLPGKIPAADQGNPDDLIAEEGEPGSPSKGCSPASRGLWDEVLQVCVGSGREAMSSALHSCVENQHLKTHPFYFQNCFFSVQKL